MCLFPAGEAVRDRACSKSSLRDIGDAVETPDRAISQRGCQDRRVKVREALAFSRACSSLHCGRPTKYAICVQVILGARTPFQILDSIVRSKSVLVVYIEAVTPLLPRKREHYEPMDAEDSHAPINPA